MKKFIALSFIIILCGCTSSSGGERNKTGAALANPASTFCAEQGGEVEIRDEENGQVGYCHLEDGTEIEEWEFFRKNDEQEKDITRSQIPEGCETWFDGCNSCMIGGDGVSACTRKFCPPEMMKEPKCVKFKEIRKEKAGEIFCGGITGSSCEEGTVCQLDGQYPDAGGKCVLKETEKRKPNMEDFSPDFTPGPPLIIYKTKKDYSTLVPVGLLPDGKTISNYPDIGDVIFSDTGKLRTPTKLVRGYLLDNQGVWKDSVFLSVDYKTYANYSEAPDMKELSKFILDDDPFLEIYNCGNRKNMTVDQVNFIINSGQLKKCKS